MKAFYEKWQEERTDFAVVKGGDKTFPPHFHENVEIFISKKGGYDITVNGEKFNVGENTVIFIDSYDIHSYENRQDEKDENYTLIIPPKFLNEYKKKKGKKKIAKRTVRDENLCEILLGICYEHLCSQNDNVTEAAFGLLFSYIELFFGFSEGEEIGDVSLIKKILGYAQENFTGDVSLSDLAKKTGYSKEHLSRTFHKYMKKGFPSYVNSLRLDFIERELAADRTQKITTLLFCAGFNSVQAYYRAKNK